MFRSTGTERPERILMSFVFEWDKLDDEVALQIEGMIHAHFQRIPKPAFMGNIAVSKFRFGSTPPSITVLDVTDPLEEWYVHMDQEEARLAQEAAEAGGGESMDEDELASEDEDDYGEYSFSADGSIVMVGEGDDIEYLQSGPFEEDERRETEEWLSNRLRPDASIAVVVQRFFFVNRLATLQRRRRIIAPRPKGNSWEAQQPGLEVGYLNPFSVAQGLQLSCRDRVING
ncbi:Mitochondrial distribution and morphology protein 12 [Podila verticillata]|nr:Mitochondrial distribution and morphology protein 12 [Podila verticillata]